MDRDHRHRSLRDWIGRASPLEIGFVATVAAVEGLVWLIASDPSRPALHAFLPEAIKAVLLAFAAGALIDVARMMSIGAWGRWLPVILAIAGPAALALFRPAAVFRLDQVVVTGIVAAAFAGVVLGMLIGFGVDVGRRRRVAG